MVDRLFVDTGYLLALLNPKDQHHDAAAELAELVEEDDFVTSEMVLCELLNGLSDKGEKLRRLAADVVRQFKSTDSKVVVVPQTSEQFEQALALYAEREDKEWGLTDCASCLIMQAMGIADVLAYDHHFEQMGFNPLLRKAREIS